MLHRIDLRGLEGPLDALLPRPDLDSQVPTSAVREIISQVRQGGDAAIRKLTTKFDQVDVGAPRVSDIELEKAWKSLEPDLAAALELAYSRILHFHEQEAGAAHQVTQAEIKVTSLSQAVERAGLYVPGGLANYPSSVLMNAIPARVAGVPRIVMVVPTPDGEVNPLVLVAAKLAGVDEIYRIGGAQAVAALAYGTKTIAPVNVIVGPAIISIPTCPKTCFFAAAT